MKKFATFILACMCCCLLNCSKTADGIFIAVQNATFLDFKEVITSNKSFKNIKAGNISSYTAFEQAADVPSATIVTTGNDTIVAGVLYYDYMGLLSDGRYVLKVFDDPSAFSGYSCLYIKN